MRQAFSMLLPVLFAAAASGADPRPVVHDTTNGLGDADVYALTFVGKTLWAGTQNGLSRLEPGGERWQTTRREGKPAGNVITCLAPDGEHLWVGTEQDLDRFHTVRKKWLTPPRCEPTLPANYISALLATNGHLWVGTWRAGLYKVNTATLKAKAVSLAGTKAGRPQSVYALAGKDENLYVGTEQGLLILNTSDDSWRNITNADGLPSNMISALAIDKNDLWIGTAVGPARLDTDEGKLSVWTLNKLHRDKSLGWVMMPSAQGCPVAHGVISQIVPDGQHIWFATFRTGIGRFNKETGTWSKNTNGGPGGLRTKGAHALVAQGVKIWLATPTSYYGRGLLLVDKDIYQ